ncbi:2-amino-4-hydroxy-6-hydroxymethyldihydropteridine diphosphokinase [Allosphingosinicella indica]|uniref:2-amino-4-hydroxy-6-hydroxymethyldihydropteridine pyrophosphokinase n=1 Tax=Allosphingosinicella indica TaxID=941907 RepID=A0A1X7FZ49_9SPHN|nr:2-amino-4-hydroxy-6-hydroxymethyldihydropteridine diphosphokinase [Allosphingosinicella indica]SMF61286.1 2-amino-4-hydroxy-6-hydroxymethyldihydropteridinediphosphokinase [Allosphingosinicella indica]
MGKTSYAIALGSNRRHGRHGAPEAVLRAAVAEIGKLGDVIRVSRIISTPPLGPAGRSFANAALLLESELNPPALLAALKTVEHRFGRRRGRRWGPRVLDLDIILWSGGMWAGDGLTVPHPAFRTRGFVLEPLAEIAPLWRDPVNGRTVRQLRARLTRPRPAPRCVAKGR